MTFTSTSLELSRDIYGSLVLNTPNNLVFFMNFFLLGSLYPEDIFNWYMILWNTLWVAKVSFTRLTAKLNKIMYVLFYLGMQYRLMYSYQDVLNMLFETLSGHPVKRFFFWWGGTLLTPWIEEPILWRPTEFFEYVLRRPVSRGLRLM